MTTRIIGNDKIEFINKYFPLSQTSHPAIARLKHTVLANPFEALKHANTLEEETLQHTFIDIVDRHEIAQGLRLQSCESMPNASGADSEVVGPSPPGTDVAFWRDGATLFDRKPRWMDQIMPVVFKAYQYDDNLQDPFHDDSNVPGGVVVSDSQSRTSSFSGIISHAELVFTVQQRLAVFMLVVIGRTCRFLRWDHSGAVVTQAIDYYEDWECFCDTLWRISECSDEVLGVDPSAVRLSPEDEDFKYMDRAAIHHQEDVDQTERRLDSVPQAPFTFVYVRDLFRTSLHEQWPRYKLEVPHGNAARHFLVCKPVFCAKGLIGRGTRGYVPLDCDTGRFVWLKDTWRAVYLRLEKEGDILAKLNAGEVPFIPTLVCHGDIRDQTTLTSQEWELKHPDPRVAKAGVASSSAKRKRVDSDSADVPPPKGLSGGDLPFRGDCPLRIYKHYRLVEEEVAMSLSKFRTGAQLASIIYECIFAHFKAATNPVHPTLHGDVSGGNVLIYPRIVYDKQACAHIIQWSGLLADWEMSKPIVDESDRKVGQRQPERMGTWQYMSVTLLSRAKAIEICDELEAFLYVLLYYAARYLRSNIGDVTLANYLDAFFDQYTDGRNDGYYCGITKLRAIERGEIVVNDVVLEFGGPMDYIIGILLSWFKSHHVVTRYKRIVAEKPKEQEAQANMSFHTTDGAKEPKRVKLVFPGATDLPGPTPTFELKKKEQRFQPSPEDWIAWKYVKTYRPVFQLFEAQLAKKWPKKDKVRDCISEARARLRSGL